MMNADPRGRRQKMADPAFNAMFPPEMRAFAEQSVAQAKKAFDDLMSATQHAVATFEGRTTSAQSGLRGLQQKVVTFSEQNVAASFEFAQQLLHAKTGEEVVRLHAEFVKAQMKALAEQAQELTRHAASSVPRSGNGRE
jgi:phasin